MSASKLARTLPRKPWRSVPDIRRVMFRGASAGETNSMARPRRSDLRAVAEDRPTSGAISIAAVLSSDSDKPAPMGRDWRARLESPVSMRSSEFEDFTTGEAVNISVSGLQCLSEHPYPCGAVLKLEFRLPGDDEVEIRCSGEVVWSDQEDGDAEAPRGMGLRFLELADIDQQAIEKLVHETHGMPPKARTRSELLEQLSQTEAEFQEARGLSERIDANRRNEIDQLGRTIQANIQARLDLEKSLGLETAAFESMRSDLEQNRAELASPGQHPAATQRELQERLTKARTALAEMQESHQTLKESQSQASQEREAAASSSREEVAALTSTRERLQTELLQIQESLSESEVTTTSLKSPVQELEGSPREPDPGRQQLAEAVESAQRQTNKLLATLGETNDKLSHTQAERAEFEKRLAESSLAKAEAERMAEGSGEANAALSVDLENSLKRAATAEAESTKHLQRIEELESVLSGLRQEIVDLSGKQAEMETLHRADLEKACSELRAGEESRASLQAELERSVSESEEFAQKVGFTLEAVRKAFAAQEELAERGRSVAEILEEAQRTIATLDA